MANRDARLFESETIERMRARREMSSSEQMNGRKRAQCSSSTLANERWRGTLARTLVSTGSTKVRRARRSRSGNPSSVAG